MDAKTTIHINKTDKGNNNINVENNDNITKTMTTVVTIATISTTYLPDFLVNVDGKKSGGRVENGSEVAHESRQHDGHHDAAHPVRQETQHQIRICKISACINKDGGWKKSQPF